MWRNCLCGGARCDAAAMRRSDDHARGAPNWKSADLRPRIDEEARHERDRQAPGADARRANRPRGSRSRMTLRSEAGGDVIVERWRPGLGERRGDRTGLAHRRAHDALQRRAVDKRRLTAQGKRRIPRQHAIQRHVIPCGVGAARGGTDPESAVGSQSAPLRDDRRRQAKVARFESPVLIPPAALRQRGAQNSRIK